MIHRPCKPTLRIIGAALLAAAGLALCATPATAADDGQAQSGGLHYEFGRGLRLGESGFTLGGYATAEYRDQQSTRARLKSSHASAFIWWEGLERIKVFAEIDLMNLTQSHRGDGHSDDRRVSLERLYADYAFGDLLTVRAGKFLTPIGRWNVMHADPLVWTTTRPLVTQALFPHNVTGIGASGTWTSLLGRSVGYTVYASNGQEWRADPGQDPFSVVRGGRVTLPLGMDVQFGLSFARYEQRGSRGEARALGGFDLFWSRNGYELSAEWLRTSADHPAPPPAPNPAAPATPAAQAESPTPAPPVDQRQPEPHGDTDPATRAGYVQGVMPLVGRLYAVARFDWMRDPRSPVTVRQGLLGLVWRPNPATAIKLEYLRSRRGTPGEPEGIVASASVLF